MLVEPEEASCCIVAATPAQFAAGQPLLDAEAAALGKIAPRRLQAAVRLLPLPLTPALRAEIDNAVLKACCAAHCDPISGAALSRLDTMVATLLAPPVRSRLIDSTQRADLIVTFATKLPVGAMLDRKLVRKLLDNTPGGNTFPLSEEAKVVLSMLAGNGDLLPAWLRPVVGGSVVVTQSQAVVVAYGAVAALHGAGLATEQRALQLIKAAVGSDSWGTSLQVLIDQDMHKGAASMDQRVHGACALALVRAPPALGLAPRTPANTARAVALAIRLGLRKRGGTARLGVVLTGDAVTGNRLGLIWGGRKTDPDPILRLEWRLLRGRVRWGDEEAPAAPRAPPALDNPDLRLAGARMVAEASSGIALGLREVCEALGRVPNVFAAVLRQLHRDDEANAVETAFIDLLDAARLASQEQTASAVKLYHESAAKCKAISVDIFELYSAGALLALY